MAAVQLWTKQLAEFDDNTIRKALEDCPNQFQWAPEIAEFKALCKNFKAAQTNNFGYQTPGYEKKRNYSERESPLKEWWLHATTEEKEAAKWKAK